MKKVIIALLLGATMFSFDACSRKVTRVDSAKTIDLSGRWNDSDSRLVSAEMVDQILSDAWLNNFMIKHGRKPVVIVGLVKNKTHEHIDPETFVKDVEQSFIKSQKVRLVNGGAMRNELRAVRADQQNNAALSTIKKFGMELGADYILQGNINDIIDQHKKEKVVFYQTNLQLSDIETTEVVWIGDKKIKKFIQN